MVGGRWYGWRFSPLVLVGTVRWEILGVGDRWCVTGGVGPVVWAAVFTAGVGGHHVTGDGQRVVVVVVVVAVVIWVYKTQQI